MVGDAKRSEDVVSMVVTGALLNLTVQHGPRLMFTSGKA